MKGYLIIVGTFSTLLCISQDLYITTNGSYIVSTKRNLKGEATNMKQPTSATRRDNQRRGQERMFWLNQINGYWNLEPHIGGKPQN
jgi:hypothetical protein